MDKQNKTIKNFPEELRPRERLKKYGASALADYELLSIILGSGSVRQNVLDMSRDILVRFEGWGGLDVITMEQLKSVHGIGFGRACTILSLVEISRRMGQVRIGDIPQQISDSDSAAKVLRSMLINGEQECFMVLFLDTKNHVISSETLFRGTLDYSVVHPRDIFRQAVRHNARSVLCAHNHPSGDIKPSREDEKITYRLIESGKILEINLLDHLIVTHKSDQFFSFRESGTLSF